MSIIAEADPKALGVHREGDNVAVRWSDQDRCCLPAPAQTAHAQPIHRILRRTDTHQTHPDTTVTFPLRTQTDRESRSRHRLRRGRLRACAGPIRGPTMALPIRAQYCKYPAAYRRRRSARVGLCPCTAHSAACTASPIAPSSPRMRPSTSMYRWVFRPHQVSGKALLVENQAVELFRSRGALGWDKAPIAPHAVAPAIDVRVHRRIDRRVRNITKRERGERLARFFRRSLRKSLPGFPEKPPERDRRL